MSKFVLPQSAEDMVRINTPEVRSVADSNENETQKAAGDQQKQVRVQTAPRHKSKKLNMAKIFKIASKLST